jgi:hypothetical protein
MSLLFYRSFATELMKIASGLLDADIRRLLAERAGDPDYLEGGELPANAPPIEKNSFLSYMPPSTYNVRGKRPTGEGSAYETASNLSSSALKGGMTGGGVYALGHNLRHGFEEGAKKMSGKHLGKAVSIGSVVALTDRALRHLSARKRLALKRGHEKHAALVSESAGAAFRTPALSLKRTSQVGKARAVHLGNKFRLPNY